MWYAPKHKRSWWKTHATELLTATGFALVFGLPVFILFTA